MGQLNSNGLTAMYNTFNALPATGSATGEGGAGVARPSRVQVQNAVNAWVCATPDYNGQVVGSYNQSIISAMKRCCQKTIESGVGGTEANGWIGPGSGGYAKISAGAAGLPNKGLLGMQQEFDSTDANGVRSAITPYVFYGWRVMLGHITGLVAPGLINRAFTGMQAAVAQAHRCYQDIDYKSEQGYRNWEKGSGDVYSETGTGANGGITYAVRIDGGARVRGYTLTHWADVLHPWLTA
jgi:hypothetical protein